MRELLRRRAPRLLLSLVLAQTVLSGALVVLYAGLAVDALGASVSVVGLLTSAYGLGGVVGSVGLFALAGSKRLGVYTVAALWLWAMPLIVLPVMPSLVAVLALLAVVGVGNVLFDVTIVTLLQRAVPDHLLTRAFGALETVVVLGLGLGAIAAPVLERLLGPAVTLAALAGLLAALGLAALPELRGFDAQLAAPTRQVLLLRDLGPFALLPTPELEALARRMQPVQVAVGQDVVVQGEPGDRYFIVDRGTLAVSVDQRLVAELSNGEAFGEIALLHERPRTATVTARTAASLWALEGAAFVAAMRSDGGRALTAADGVARTRLQRAAPIGSMPAPATQVLHSTPPSHEPDASPD
jgi:MFS family permease